MRVPALEGHRLWADTYDTSPNALLALESRLVRERLGGLSWKRVIDVACGTGRWAAWFAARGARVWGLDFCAEMLMKSAPALRGRAALGCAGALPFGSGAADLAICSFAAGYFPHLDPAVREMARITRPGGHVLVSDMHPDAVAAGWTRSFRSRGRTYRLEHFAHSVECMRGSLARAGLKLDIEIHGHFGESERHIFDEAGRAECFDQVCAIPAVWIGICRKP